MEQGSVSEDDETGGSEVEQGSVKQAKKRKGDDLISVNAKKRKSFPSKGSLADVVLGVIKKIGGDVSLKTVKQHVLKNSPKFKNALKNRRFMTAMNKLLTNGFIDSIDDGKRVRLAQVSHSSGANYDVNMLAKNALSIIQAIPDKRITRQKLQNALGTDTKTCSSILDTLMNEGHINRENRHTFCAVESEINFEQSDKDMTPPHESNYDFDLAQAERALKINLESAWENFKIYLFLSFKKIAEEQIGA